MAENSVNSQKPEQISYYAHEAEVARQERHTKRLWILVIVMIVYCAVMTGLYIYEKTQYETIEVTQEVDTGEGNATVAGVGDINYGESQTDG